MASQLFPGRRFGVIYGMLSVGNGIGGGIAPWFGGVVHDLTGSYRVAFLVAVGFCVLGSVCFWLRRPPARRAAIHYADRGRPDGAPNTPDLPDARGDNARPPIPRPPTRLNPR